MGKKKPNKHKQPSPVKKPNKISGGFLSNLYGATDTTAAEGTEAKDNNSSDENGTITPSTVLKTKAKLPFSDDIHDEEMTPNHPHTGRKKPNPHGLSLKDDLDGEATALLPKSERSEGLKDVAGFLIISCVVLVGDTARGVMFPTLWPLVKSLGGSRVHQGIAVASFSFGRVISSPILGKKSVKDGYRSTLTISLSMLLVGTLAYSLAPAVDNLYWLIMAQVIMGLGSGTLGVTRAYVAEITPRKDRTEYIAMLTAVQYGGFTVMPIVGSFFCKMVSNCANSMRM